MGWLWSSQPPSKGPKEDSTIQAQAQEPPAPTQPEPTYSDPEIAKFMADLQDAFGGSKSEPPAPSSKSTSTTSSHIEQADNQRPVATPGTTSESPWRSLWGPAAQSETSSSSSSSGVYTNTGSERADERQRPQHPDRLDPISESLLPVTMSCRNALDAAFYCQSPGGQWNAVYREGEVRSCSAHWDDLFFCMRVRTMGGKMKEEAIRDHYRKKELAKYGPGKPSSTDIWESREVKVEPGTAFTERYDPPNVSDEEWRALEIRNRRAVQETLANGQS